MLRTEPGNMEICQIIANLTPLVVLKAENPTPVDR